MKKQQKAVVCKKCNHSPMVMRLEDDFYVYKSRKLKLTDLPVFVCPKCNNKFYSKIYKFKRNKQIKNQAAKISNYQKTLNQKDLLEIRTSLGVPAEQIDPLIAAKFGDYAKWESGKEKIPAAYNLILKLIKKELDSGKNISVVNLLKKERYWWKG